MNVKEFFKNRHVWFDSKVSLENQAEKRRIVDKCLGCVWTKFSFLKVLRDSCGEKYDGEDL